MKLYYIEGLIGIGKSYNLDHNDIFKDFKVLQQQVHKWQNLEDFYLNPKEHAYKLQLEILQSYVDMIEPYENTNVKLAIESGPIGSLYVFMPSLLEKGYLTQEQVGYFETSCKYTNPDGIFLVRGSIDQCMINIKKRNRPSEHLITREYLQSLEDNINNIYIPKFKDIITYI